MLSRRNRRYTKKTREPRRGGGAARGSNPTQHSAGVRPTVYSARVVLTMALLFTGFAFGCHIGDPVGNVTFLQITERQSLTIALPAQWAALFGLSDDFRYWHPSGAWKAVFRQRFLCHPYLAFLTFRRQDLSRPAAALEFHHHRSE